MTICCKTCVWYLHRHKRRDGRCLKHKHAKIPNPSVFSADWCGEYQLNEYKLTKEV